MRREHNIELLAADTQCGIADLLAQMRKYEKEHDIEPDWNVHAFMKAQSIQGQQSSVATEYVIRMLGLDICADTICGNHMMRGISGGQKKRVTSGMIPVYWSLMLCSAIQPSRSSTVLVHGRSLADSGCAGTVLVLRSW